MSVIFGPVVSRRLGYSLGVDVVPSGEKTCTLDCIYCQAGRTVKQTIDRREYIPTAGILKEIDAMLPMKDIHFITFSGSGEPTLHKKLGQIIQRIKARTRTPVAVITNGTLMDRPDVRRDLALADLVVPSLDAVTPEVFAKINRPHPSLRIDNIIKGMAQFRREYKGEIWVEVLLVKGVNDDVDELMRINEALTQIDPHRVHLNTVTRPPAETDALPLDEQEMQRIAGIFGPKATVIGVASHKDKRHGATNLEDGVVELVKRRGITAGDLVEGLGMHRDVAQDVLDKLVQANKIKKVSHGGVTYYREYY
ncbi:MAG TPA: radical SAM protein [bacterium]|nr:radical SAM protein [bacterium]